MRFDFDAKIEKEVLENYLSRCATAAGLYQSETLSDDLRVIKKLGIKFLGRASGIWYMTENDEEHFERSRKLAERVHELDPEIILQACVFEMITQGRWKFRCMCCAHLDRRKKSDVSGCRIHFLWIDRRALFMKTAIRRKTAAFPIFPG